MAIDISRYDTDPGVLLGIAVFVVAMLVWLIWLVIRAQRLRRVSGDVVLVDQRTTLLEALPVGGEAWTWVDGEYWRVCSAVALPAGTRVRVTRREGLLLWVEPV